MSLEDFELVEEKVQDIRFGIINIFNSLDDKEYLIMEKSRRSYSQEDHAFSCMQAEERLKIKHPNILRMLWVDKDDLNWVTSAYFEYPNEDLCDRKEELNDPRELIRLLNDMLEAMTYLQRHKMVHGDIRPEYIFFNRATERYVLLDRLIDASPAHQAQMNNIFYQDKTLYMSPVLFNELCQGNLRIKHNPFKSEVFSLGMVILSMFMEEADINRCYNRRLKEFDYREFTMIADHLKNSIFTGNIEDLLGEYLFLCILNLNEKERLSPKKALKILRKGICKALNTIIPNPELKPSNELEMGVKTGEVNMEAQNLWEQYHSAKDKIEAESQTEKESNFTGSLKSGTQQFVNDEGLNMPNIGGGDVQEEEEDEGSQDKFGYNESMPVNSNSPLIKASDMEPFSKSNSISYMKEYESEAQPEEGTPDDSKPLVVKSKDSDNFDSKVDLEASNQVKENMGDVEIEVETEDIPDEKQESNKLRIFEVMNENSMSGTNYNEDTFYGSGSNQGDKIMGLNDIYEQDINKLQNFLQNTGEEEQESKDDIVLSRRSENESQRLYQSNASGYESEKPEQLSNFQSYSKVEDVDFGNLEEEKGGEKEDLTNEARESTRKIKKIFRGRSDEDLRGDYFDGIQDDNEFDIDAQNLALGEMLQKMNYQSGEDYMEIAAKNPTSKEDHLKKNEEHYFSYRTDLENGKDVSSIQIPDHQRSPDFGKKEMIDLGKLKKESMHIQIEERDKEGNEEKEEKEKREEEGRTMNKVKGNQFSMSNKEFLKSQEEAMKLLHGENTGRTKDLMIHEAGAEQQGFNNTNTFYATPGEEGSLGDTFDKQMKMKLAEEGVQIVEGDLAEDSDTEPSSRVIEESLAKNQVGIEGKSEETHRLKKSLSIESNEESQVESVRSLPQDEEDSEKLSEVEKISIDTEEFLQGNSGISSRLNSPTSLKTEECVADIKRMKEQRESLEKNGESSPDISQKMGVPVQPSDEVLQELNTVGTHTGRVIISSLEIEQDAGKLYSEGVRSVHEHTKEYFQEIGIPVAGDQEQTDLRKSQSERDFKKKTTKSKCDRKSVKVVKQSFKKKGEERSDQEPIEIETEYNDLVLLDDVELGEREGERSGKGSLQVESEDESSVSSESKKSEESEDTGSFSSELRDKISEKKSKSSECSSEDNLEFTHPKAIKKESIFYINNKNNLGEKGKSELVGLEELSFISSLVKGSLGSLTKDIRFNLVQNLPDSHKTLNVVDLDESQREEKAMEDIPIVDNEIEENESLLLTEEEPEQEKKGKSIEVSEAEKELNMTSRTESTVVREEENRGSHERHLDIAEIESESTVKVGMFNELGDERGSLPLPSDFESKGKEGEIMLEKGNFLKKSENGMVESVVKEERSSKKEESEKKSWDSLEESMNEGEETGGFQMIITKDLEEEEKEDCKNVTLERIAGEEMEDMSEKESEEERDLIEEGNMCESEDQPNIDFGVYGTDKTANSSSTGSHTLKTHYLKNPSIFKSITSDKMDIEEEQEKEDEKEVEELERVQETPGSKGTPETFSRQQQKMLEEALQDYTDESSMMNRVKELPEKVDESVETSGFTEENESGDIYQSPKKREGDQLIDIIDGENGQKMEIEIQQEQVSSTFNKPSSSENFRPITEVTEDPSFPSMSSNLKTSEIGKCSQKVLERVPESKRTGDLVDLEQSGEQHKPENMNLESIAKEVRLEKGHTKGISPKNIKDHKNFSGDFKYEHVTELRNSRKHSPTGIENYQSEGNGGVDDEKLKMVETGNLQLPGNLNHEENLVHSALVCSPNESRVQGEKEDSQQEDSNLEEIRQAMEKIPQGEGSFKGLQGFLDTDQGMISKEDSKVMTQPKMSSGKSETKQTMTLSDKLQVGYHLESELQDESEGEKTQEEGARTGDMEVDRLSERSVETEKDNEGRFARKSQSLQHVSKQSEGESGGEESSGQVGEKGNRMLQSELLEESGDQRRGNEGMDYQIPYSKSTHLGQSDTMQESLLKMKELKEHSNFSSIGPKNFKSSELRTEGKEEGVEKDLIHREMENETNSEESESEILEQHGEQSDQDSYIHYDEDDHQVCSSTKIAQSLQVPKGEHFSLQKNFAENAMSEGKLLMSSEQNNPESEEEVVREDDRSFSSQNETEEIEITDDEEMKKELSGVLDSSREEKEGEYEVDNEMKVINSMEGVSVVKDEEVNESEVETHYKEKPFRFDDELSEEVRTEGNTLVEDFSKPQSEEHNVLYPSKSYHIEKNTFKKIGEEELEEELGRNRLKELEGIRTTESRFHKLGSEGKESSLKKSETDRDMSTSKIQEKGEEIRHSTPVPERQKVEDESNYLSRTMEMTTEQLMDIKLECGEGESVEKEEGRVKESTRYVQTNSGNLNGESEKQSLEGVGESGESRKEDDTSQVTIHQNPVQFSRKDNENLSDKTIEKDIRFAKGEETSHGENGQLDESSETNILEKGEKEGEESKNIQIEIPPGSSISSSSNSNSSSSSEKGSLKKVVGPEVQVQEPQELDLETEDPSKTASRMEKGSGVESEIIVSNPQEEVRDPEITLENIPKIVSNLETKENVTPKREKNSEFDKSEDEHVEVMEIRITKESDSESELEEPSEESQKSDELEQEDSGGIKVEIHKKDIIAQMNEETPVGTVDEEPPRKSQKGDSDREGVNPEIADSVEPLDVNVFKTNPSPEIKNSLTESEIKKCESTDNAPHYIRKSEGVRSSRFNRQHHSKKFRERSVEYDDLQNKFVRSIKYNPPVIKSRSRSYTPNKKNLVKTIEKEIKTSVIIPQKSGEGTYREESFEKPRGYLTMTTRKVHGEQPSVYQSHPPHILQNSLPPSQHLEENVKTLPKDSRIKSKFIKGKAYNRERSNRPDRRYIVLEEEQYGLKVRRKSIEPGPKPFSKMKNSELWTSNLSPLGTSQTIDLTASLPNVKGAIFIDANTSSKVNTWTPDPLKYKSQVNLPSNVNAKVILQKQQIPREQHSESKVPEIKKVKQKYIVTRGRRNQPVNDIRSLKEKYKMPLRISPAKYSKKEVKRYLPNVAKKTVQTSPIRSVSMEKPVVSKISIKRKAPVVQSTKNSEVQTLRKIRQYSSDVKQNNKKSYNHEIDLISDNCSEYKETKAQRLNEFFKGSSNPKEFQGSSKRITSKYNSIESDSLKQSNYKSNKFQTVIEKERRKQIENVKQNKLSQSMATPSISSTIKKYGFTAKGISRITRGSPSPGRSRNTIRIENSRSPETLYKKEITSKRSAKIYNPSQNTTFRKIYKTKQTIPAKMRKVTVNPNSKYAKFRNANWKKAHPVDSTQNQKTNM